MTVLQKIEIGILVTIALAVLSFAFWLGSFSQRLESLELRTTKLEASKASSGASVLSAMPPEPTALGSPAVTLTPVVDVDPQRAPFKVGVTGTVTGATRLYTYLVVDDGHTEWIQPGLGYNRDGSFFATAYLGLESGSASVNKWYTVFAVISANEHKEYQHLNSGSVRVRSKLIRVYRTR